MDKAVKLFALIAMLAAGAAQAQALSDPTRPPSMLVRTPAGAPVAASAAPVLQSVLIGRQAGGRQVAVIDGETVRLGGTFRGAVLVRMTETEVELQRGRERQVLKLFAANGSQDRSGPPTLARRQ
jgi:MSHA biogenesis protein MshK